MRVLVVGKGGREHALADKILQSPLLEKLWVAPGNPGMELQGLACHDLEKPEDVVEFAQANSVDLVVLGPEAAILSDLKWRLMQKGIACFSPDQNVARLEASKLFCKDVLGQAGVPTAGFYVARNLAEAMRFVRTHDFISPLVVKADGLAAGKGVAVCENQDKALVAAQELGDAFGYPLLLEECLRGRELSAFALCDGEDFVVLGTACDYKRITPDLFSANTGGMGAFSPCDFISSDDDSKIQDYFRRTLQTLKAQGSPYQGFLFMGLMKTENDLYVLEYNVRMGDPETQALLPRLKTDLLELMWKAAGHQLRSAEIRHYQLSSVHVVMASEGYPAARMNLGHPIIIPETRKGLGQIYFAGVGQRNGHLINTGGRVLGVTSLGETKELARQRAYDVIREISFNGNYYRQDIGE